MGSLIAKIAASAVAALIFSSCASTSVKDTWLNPDLSAAKLTKALVVSTTMDSSSRRLDEDILVDELRRRGVKAVPGYTVVEANRADLQTLQRAVAKTGADGVLTVQTIRVEQQSSYQPGYISNYPDFWYPSAFPSWNFYGYYGSTTSYEPPYLTTWEVTTVQANLFDAGSGKLRWAATVQSSEPPKSVSYSKEVARVIVHALVKEGVI